MKKLLSLLLAMALVLTMSGCKKEEEPEEKEEAKLPVIYYCAPRSGGAFWSQVLQGVKDAAAELGVTECYDLAPTEKYNTTQIIDNMNTAKTQGAEVVLSIFGDPQTYGTILKELADAGIITGSINSPTDDATFNTGGIYSTRAKKWFEELDSLTDGKEQLNILFVTSNAGTQTDEFRKTLDQLCEERGNAAILEMVFVAGDAASASDKTAAALAAYPEINAIISSDADGAVGAGQYVKEQGLQDQIKLVVESNSADCLNLVLDGIIDKCAYIEAYWMGHQAVELAVKKYQGGEVDKYNDPTWSIITKENAEQYAADNDIDLGR